MQHTAEKKGTKRTFYCVQGDGLCSCSNHHMQHILDIILTSYTELSSPLCSVLVRPLLTDEDPSISRFSCLLLLIIFIYICFFLNFQLDQYSGVSIY